MSTTKKSLLFLAITFAISWGVTLGAHFAGLTRDMSPYVGLAILVTMMTGPAIAAVICVFAFEKGRRIEALGVQFKPNWWWLLAWAIPLALAAISIAATLVLGGRTYVDPGTAAAASASAQGTDLSQVPPFFLSTTFILLASVVIGALFNAIPLTLTEELGWRGYLYDLWRPGGFWRSSLATGAIWGVWHAPAILFYGLNYPSHAQLGAAIFIVWCALLSPIMTLIRDRGGATWAAGIAHGTINAVAGVTIMTVSDSAFPWTGLVGIGGFVALALGVIAVIMLQRKPAAG